MTRWNENDDPEVWAQRMAYVREQALKRDEPSGISGQLPVDNAEDDE